mgnify:CR=1 FL=1
MKPYIFYYADNDKIHSMNLLCKDLDDANDVAIRTKMILMGEKISEKKTDETIVNQLIDFMRSGFQTDYKNWFNNLNK